MRSAMGAVVLTTALLGLVGCASDPEPTLVPQLSAPRDVGVPAFDPELAPSAAVLALVPTSATDLAVTDFERVRLDLGATELTGSDPRAESARFWARAERTEALLTTGRLRDVDAELVQRFGWGMDDVDWEAVFGGPDGVGWVLKIRDDLPMGDISRAVDAGIGPLEGATVDTAQHLVSVGATGDGAASWAAEPELVELVGPQAQAVFVTRSCVEEAGLEDLPGAETDDLDELGPFSVVLGSELAAAHLGPARSDAFARLGLPALLPATDPAFDGVFAQGAADPGGGRLGWQLADPAAAARLTLERQLPFAACAD